MYFHSPIKHWLLKFVKEISSIKIDNIILSKNHNQKRFQTLDTIKNNLLKNKLLNMTLCPVYRTDSSENLLKETVISI